MNIQGRIDQANGRLKAARIAVRIETRGNRLCLRATLPPKPNSSLTRPHQQRLTLGVHVNPAGVKVAEAEARKLGIAIDGGDFDWSLYVKDDVQRGSVGDWIRRFETDYFTRRERNPKSQTTWRHDYLKVFSQLPPDEPLTIQLLMEAIASTKPDTRTRKRFVDVCTRLADFAGLNTNFRHLRGNYSSAKVTPRDLPDDGLIAEYLLKIPNPLWQRVYGLIATYGLRPHEVFKSNFARFPVLQVENSTKTGSREVYPFYPEWAESWQLLGELPAVTGATNSDLGNRVTHAFSRYAIPFNAYDLRHRWAVRTLEFGLDVSLAAQQMGHSVRIHCETYHQWIGRGVHQRAFEAILERSDRPMAPLR